jgi:hypothetical protein
LADTWKRNGAENSLEKSTSNGKQVEVTTETTVTKSSVIDKVLEAQTDSLMAQASSLLQSSSDLVSYASSHLKRIKKRMKFTPSPHQIIRRQYFPDTYFFAYKNPFKK